MSGLDKKVVQALVDSGCSAKVIEQATNRLNAVSLKRGDIKRIENSLATYGQVVLKTNGGKLAVFGMSAYRNLCANASKARAAKKAPTQ